MFISLRKADLAIQFIAACLVILFIPFGGFYVLPAGFFIIHIIQVLSGLINTLSFYSNDLGKPILYYWTATLICFLTLLLPGLYLLYTYAFSMMATVSYWIIYASLSKKLESRKVLNGLIKSKH